jgi:hypothetical protein
MGFARQHPATVLIIETPTLRGASKNGVLGIFSLRHLVGKKRVVLETRAGEIREAALGVRMTSSTNPSKRWIDPSQRNA